MNVHAESFKKNQTSLKSLFQKSLKKKNNWQYKLLIICDLDFRESSIQKNFKPLTKYHQKHSIFRKLCFKTI